MKVGNENASHVLNILYANNQFEPTITCDSMINSSNIQISNPYDTKYKNIISIMKLRNFNLNEKGLIGILK